ncbi:hypothetical protein FOZ62_001311 [Perkinsus olseni]|uniref:Uncharacterized protein n=1 Tax=Perkinsus olseni TaxID=32597 RepID=A0A7J6N7B2_PEROL|nr:hypothetical protein FOZ62_001311 [Perkinsus olseni]
MPLDINWRLLVIAYTATVLVGLIVLQIVVGSIGLSTAAHFRGGHASLLGLTLPSSVAMVGAGHQKEALQKDRIRTSTTEAAKASPVRLTAPYGEVDKEPNSLHVVYACDKEQMEALKASVASLVSNTAEPGRLHIHLLVGTASDHGNVAEVMGIPSALDSITLRGGTRVSLLLVESQTMMISNVDEAERGNIRAVENYARFYLDRILPMDSLDTVVVYLDADTIVLGDVAEVASALLGSGGAAVALAQRNEPTTMEAFLQPDKRCLDLDVKERIGNLRSKTAYNAGVMGIHLGRWKSLHIRDRVEQWISWHNKCRIWKGGSQPPLLLALYDLTADQQGAEQVMVELPSEWNFANLGWKTDFAATELAGQKVLHWNGPKKPWLQNGLYVEAWLPWRKNFDSMILSSSESTPSLLTDPSHRSVNTSAACQVNLLKQKSRTACVGGHSFGCYTPSELWVDKGCKGKFAVYRVPAETSDGPVLVEALFCKSRAGTLNVCDVVPEVPDGQPCETQILTTYFTQHKSDWQREGVRTKVKYKYMRKFYESARTVPGVRVEIIHDGLPEEFIANYTTDKIKFVYCDLHQYEQRLGVNDVRYYCFKERLRANPQWEFVFTTDLTDVFVKSNPCPYARRHRDRIFVGRETVDLPNHPWMEKRFRELSGKYYNWFQSMSPIGVEDKRIFNCGILGGTPPLLLRVFDRMLEVIEDPDLRIRKETPEAEVNVNMPALNWVLFTSYSPEAIQSDQPVHSRYKSWESDRTDVWFVHK